MTEPHDQICTDIRNWFGDTSRTPLDNHRTALEEIC